MGSGPFHVLLSHLPGHCHHAQWRLGRQHGMGGVPNTLRPNPEAAPPRPAPFSTPLLRARHVATPHRKESWEIESSLPPCVPL